MVRDYRKEDRMTPRQFLEFAEKHGCADFEICFSNLVCINERRS